MCTRDFVYEDLTTIFHELGHIQYDQNYKHLPQVKLSTYNLLVSFTNCALLRYTGMVQMIIGELMAMTSSTPKHLYDLGLLDELVEDEELDLNFLMSQALITISTLPFHLVNDLWRWRAFRGEVQRNKHLKRDLKN